MHLQKAVAFFLAANLWALGCSEDESKKADMGEKTGEVSSMDVTPEQGEKKDADEEVAVDVPGLVKQIGVAPGAFAIEDGVGCEAVVSSRTGVVALRRTGEEDFQDIETDGAKLYVGDQIRTSTDSSAVVTLADESVIELAENTAVAIADRDADADPASSAAVMAGAARFTVAERGEGEGPFLVYTPAGIIGTVGTSYGVAVAATGDVRVGVETGEVQVAGAAALDTPVSVSAGSKIDVSGDGKVGEVLEFNTDDWGAWRDQTEAGASFSAMAKTNVEALGTLEAEIDNEYDELKLFKEAVAKAEVPVIKAKKTNNGAAYIDAAPELGIAIEASYLASMRLQFLTYAMVSRAYIANELYLRHPKEVKAIVVPASPRLYGSILYQKKYHNVVHAHVLPWRAKYYYHHPRGRAHAALVGYDVPKFYKKQKLKVLTPDAARGKLKAKVYLEPEVAKFNVKKKVWIGAPTVGWAVNVKVKPSKARGAVGWYIKAKSPKAQTWSVKIQVKKGKPVFATNKPHTKRGHGKVRIAVKHPGKKVKKHGDKGKYGHRDDKKGPKHGDKGKYGHSDDKNKGTEKHAQKKEHVKKEPAGKSKVSPGGKNEEGKGQVADGKGKGKPSEKGESKGKGQGKKKGKEAGKSKKRK